MSIIIPCFNHEKYVKSCLISILNQTYEYFEILITDDASKDKSVMRIQEVLPRFEAKKIHTQLIVNSENLGIVRNINRMLDFSRGEFVKIFASDDIMSEYYLSEMVEAFRKSNDALVLFSNGYAVKENTEYPVNEDDIINILYAECENKVQQLTLDDIFTRNEISAPAAMVRYKVYEAVGKYDEKLGIEDLDMWLRIIEQFPNSIDMLNKDLVYYRKGSESISSLAVNKTYINRAKFMFRNEMAIAKKHKAFVSNEIYCKRIFALYHEIVVAYIKSIRNSVKQRT